MEFEAIEHLTRRTRSYAADNDYDDDTLWFASGYGDEDYGSTEIFCESCGAAYHGSWEWT